MPRLARQTLPPVDPTIDEVGNAMLTDTSGHFTFTLNWDQEQQWELHEDATAHMTYDHTGTPAPVGSYWRRAPGRNHMKTLIRHLFHSRHPNPMTSEQVYDLLQLRIWNDPLWLDDEDFIAVLPNHDDFWRAFRELEDHELNAGQPVFPGPVFFTLRYPESPASP